MVPKNMSVSAADKAALLLAPPLVMVSKLVRPVIVALNWTANHIIRLFGIQPTAEVSSSFTLEEVQSIVEESTRSGLVDDQTGLITGALEFSSQTAQEIMVPLADLITLSPEATPVDFEHQVGKTGFSRFVFSDDEGTLLGYLHLKDVLRIPLERYQVPIGEGRVRSMVNLHAAEEIEDVLASMQATGTHMARVIDANEQTMGVIFLEDVIEQLVGEIRDATQTNVHERRKA